MGLFRTLVIGAAVYGAIKYITKKGEDGKSIADEIADKSSELVDKAKDFGSHVKQEYHRVTDPYTE